MPENGARIALFGKPGAGKSTFAGLLGKECSASGPSLRIIKIADPLYELQRTVYETAGVLAPEAGVQDGQLLNALGAHLRRINPNCLTDRFAVRVAAVHREVPGAVVVCDDMRAPDAAALAGMGFLLVELTAPDEVRAARKAQRGDLSPGDEQHSTERPVQAEPWRRVDNSGGLDVLRERAARLLAEVRS
ncbi:AAA family ATPase [Streptomyces sp. NPDC004290]|uniref:AAA family ATPase n=1 Tax=unclassified Streptomyces TaxID=2593676 RepID=UPI0036B2EDC3